MQPPGMGSGATMGVVMVNSSRRKRRIRNFSALSQSSFSGGRRAKPADELQQHDHRHEQMFQSLDQDWSKPAD